MGQGARCAAQGEAPERLEGIWVGCRLRSGPDFTAMPSRWIPTIPGVPEQERPWSYKAPVWPLEECSHIYMSQPSRGALWCWVLVFSPLRRTTPSLPSSAPSSYSCRCRPLLLLLLLLLLALPLLPAPLPLLRCPPPWRTNHAPRGP